ncbi:MAG: tRNA (adenosine(37)-N6)-dimethylallyltransferase, partial [Lentisphaeria bacterium]
NYCKQLIPQIQTAQKVPIIAGGTGMYASFLCNGHDQLPANQDLASKISAEYEAGNYEQLAEQLKQLDSDTYDKCCHNHRRVLRALEICTLLKGPIPTNSKSLEKPLCNNFMQYVLLFSPEKMRERISLRAIEMIENGWIEEAQTLFDLGLMQTPTARQALGYSIIYDYLNPIPRIASEKHLTMPTKESLIERLICKTAQYAKKQRTWFRNQHPNAKFIEMDKIPFEDVVNIICNSYQK